MFRHRCRLEAVPDGRIRGVFEADSEERKGSG